MAFMFAPGAQEVPAEGKMAFELRQEVLETRQQVGSKAQRLPLITQGKELTGGLVEHAVQGHGPGRLVNTQMHEESVAGKADCAKCSAPPE